MNGIMWSEALRTESFALFFAYFPSWTWKLRLYISLFCMCVCVCVCACTHSRVCRRFQNLIKITDFNKTVYTCKYFLQGRTDAAHTEITLWQKSWNVRQNRKQRNLHRSSEMETVLGFEIVSNFLRLCFVEFKRIRFRQCKSIFSFEFVVCE